MLLLTDKKVRIGAWVFFLKKLKPSDFLNDPTFPLNNLITSKVSNATESKENIDAVKESIKITLLKGISRVYKWFTPKKVDIAVDFIMDNPDLYGYLFEQIIKYSFDIKKKTTHLDHLTKITLSKYSR